MRWKAGDEVVHTYIDGWMDGGMDELGMPGFRHTRPIVV